MNSALIVDFEVIVYSSLIECHAQIN